MGMVSLLAPGVSPKYRAGFLLPRGYDPRRRLASGKLSGLGGAVIGLAGGKDYLPALLFSSHGGASCGGAPAV